ncbi:RHS repeat-associated core domain-containing protein [Pseudomonas sp. NFACC14]|uniref:RHS repeat-associated core domain-containing protein n=1 Tax=unclassified Pseudomonas TaxID=196821 RepID=UPI0035322E00
MTKAHTQHFYLKERLTSEIQGSVCRSIFQQDDQLLAQQQRQSGAVEATLLASDQQRTVLHALAAAQSHAPAYTPYGHRSPENGLLSLLGFNGERPDPVTGHYLLGNGYRAFNPVLMRFNSSDSWSPFEESGINSYVYCMGDPINMNDPSGHIGSFWRGLLSFWKTRKPKLTAPKNIILKPIGNVRNIASNITIFEDTYKEMPRLNIAGHGLPGLILVDDHLTSPTQFYEYLAQRIDTKKYNSLRLLFCHSADNPNSFGEQFATLTNKPVKAFSGTIAFGLYSKSRIRLDIGTAKIKKVKNASILKDYKHNEISGRVIPPYKSIKFHPATLIRQS